MRRLPSGGNEPISRKISSFVIYSSISSGSISPSSKACVNGALSRPTFAPDGSRDGCEAIPSAACEGQPERGHLLAVANQ